MNARRVPWALRGALCHNLVDSWEIVSVHFGGAKIFSTKCICMLKFGTYCSSYGVI